jgi:hypothetical protein
MIPSILGVLLASLFAPEGVLIGAGFASLGVAQFAIPEKVTTLKKVVISISGLSVGFAFVLLFAVGIVPWLAAVLFSGGIIALTYMASLPKDSNVDVMFQQQQVVAVKGKGKQDIEDERIAESQEQPSAENAKVIHAEDFVNRLLNRPVGLVMGFLVISVLGVIILADQFFAAVSGIGGALAGFSIAQLSMPQKSSTFKKMVISLSSISLGAGFLSLLLSYGAVFELVAILFISGFIVLVFIAPRLKDGNAGTTYQPLQAFAATDKRDRNVDKVGKTNKITTADVINSIWSFVKAHPLFVLSVEGVLLVTRFIPEGTVVGVALAGFIFVQLFSIKKVIISLSCISMGAGLLLWFDIPCVSAAIEFVSGIIGLTIIAPFLKNSGIDADTLQQQAVATADKAEQYVDKVGNTNKITVADIVNQCCNKSAGIIAGYFGLSILGLLLVLLFVTDSVFIGAGLTGLVIAQLSMPEKSTMLKKVLISLSWISLGTGSLLLFACKVPWLAVILLGEGLIVLKSVVPLLQSSNLGENIQHQQQAGAILNKIWSFVKVNPLFCISILGGLLGPLFYLKGVFIGAGFVGFGIAQLSIPEKSSLLKKVIVSLSWISVGIGSLLLFASRKPDELALAVIMLSGGLIVLKFAVPFTLKGAAISLSGISVGIGFLLPGFEITESAVVTILFCGGLIVLMSTSLLRKANDLGAVHKLKLSE